MSSIKNQIRTALMDLTGYFIHKKNGLPVGVDLKEDLLGKFAIDPRTVFDVGANVGQTALHYAEIFPAANIYSFEPFDVAYRSLEQNTSHLQQVKTFQVALGEAVSQLEVKVYDAKFSDLNSLKTINENPSEAAFSEKISVDTLDDFCRTGGINEIDLLKIDTEGYEVEVLKGGNEILGSGGIKAVLCEAALARQNQRNTQLVDLQDYLEPFGYFFVGFYDSNLNYYSDGIAYSNALFVRAVKTTDYFSALRSNDRKQDL